MGFAGHVTSHALYVGICKYAASGRLCRFSGSFSSEIDPLALQIVLSVGVGASDVTDVSGLNSFGEYKSMVFKTYSGPLTIYPRWYEFPLEY